MWHIHHREEEGFFVMDGEIKIHTEAGSYSAKKGQFVWGRKDQRHTYEVVGDEARILVVFVPGPGKQGFEPNGGIDKYFYEARNRETRTPEQLQAEGREPEGQLRPGDVPRAAAPARPEGLSLVVVSDFGLTEHWSCCRPSMYLLTPCRIGSCGAAVSPRQRGGAPRSTIPPPGT